MFLFDWLFKKKENKTQATDKIIYQFFPTKSFYSDKLKSYYVRGLSYSIKEKNEELLQEALKWAADNKIMMFKVQ